MSGPMATAELLKPWLGFLRPDADEGGRRAPPSLLKGEPLKTRMLARFWYGITDDGDCNVKNPC